jgi:hypothetical protein
VSIKYKKLKSKVEEEVKQNEIVAINQRLNDIHSKFDGFLQDKEGYIEERKRQEHSGNFKDH